MNCHYYKTHQCHSCELLDKPYLDSLVFKENELKQLFPEHVTSIKPTIGLSGNITGSRNKAKLAVFTRDQQLTFGFYHSDGTTQELENCPLHATGINALLQQLRDILNQYQITPYDLASKTGELKYLLISSSGAENTTEFLLRFVLRSKKSLPSLKQAVAAIQSVTPAIKVISANIQPIHQAILEGDEEIVLTDTAFITHDFDEFKLTLGTRSFFQVTSEIAKALYNTVADTIKTDAPTSLIDLYCGVGAFSFYAARHCPDITGIEISKEAIACAKQSAAHNHSHIHFEAMDVEDYLRTTSKRFDAVLVNPPRRGLNPAIINMIQTIAPRFIYYSSCNAKTLARDFEELKGRYQIASLQLFDMFPYTKHYETLMCLRKK
jgi:23S rRNA (uracil747-C5)-methyltransferase